MLCAFEKDISEVRFGTEKNVGFPWLSAIFDQAVRPDSDPGSGAGGGLLPHRFVGLARC